MNVNAWTSYFPNTDYFSRSGRKTFRKFQTLYSGAVYAHYLLSDIVCTAFPIFVRRTTGVYPVRLKRPTICTDLKLCAFDRENRTRKKHQAKRNALRNTNNCSSRCCFAYNQDVIRNYLNPLWCRVPRNIPRPVKYVRSSRDDNVQIWIDRLRGNLILRGMAKVRKIKGDSVYVHAQVNRLIGRDTCAWLEYLEKL